MNADAGPPKNLPTAPEETGKAHEVAVFGRPLNLDTGHFLGGLRTGILLQKFKGALSETPGQRVQALQPDWFPEKPVNLQREPQERAAVELTD